MTGLTITAADPVQLANQLQARSAEAQPRAATRDPLPRCDRRAGDAADPDQAGPRRRSPRARRARAHVAAGDVQVRRPARSAPGFVTRERGADRRRVGIELHRRGRSASSPRSSAAARPGSRRASSELSPAELEAVEAAIEPLLEAARGRRVTALLARRPPHVQEPPQPPQLPPLLHRPGHLGQRHLDAEHRARTGSC